MHTNLFTITNATDTMAVRSTHSPIDEQHSLYAKKLEDSLKKVQHFRQKQSELLSVLVVLQKEGVDVERVYSDVVSGKVSAS